MFRISDLRLTPLVSLHPQSGWPQEAPRRGACICFLGSFSHCPAAEHRRIGSIRRANCLSEASFCATGPIREAQGSPKGQGTRRPFFWFVFFGRAKKMNNRFNSRRIGRTFQIPPPEVEGFLTTQKKPGQRITSLYPETNQEVHNQKVSPRLCRGIPELDSSGNMVPERK